MRGWIVASLVMSMGCAYHAVEYESGEGSMVCITTTDLSGRLAQDYTGEVVLQEEVFEEGEKVWVNVVFHHALGEDCDVIDAAECTVSLDGTKIKVDSSAEWSYRTNRELCDGPIEPMIASCQTHSLDADSYTFQYGEMDLIVEVPSTVETPCLNLDPAKGCSTAPPWTAPWLLLPLLGLVVRRQREA
jgi:uncharacterized protein (TIGR03382 family)